MFSVEWIEKLWNELRLAEAQLPFPIPDSPIIPNPQKADKVFVMPLVNRLKNINTHFRVFLFSKMF